MLKKKGIVSGLGDRIGNYLIYAMLGEIYKKDIYTTWIYNNRRGKEYPSDIFNYIQFPKRLKFVSENEFNNLNYLELKYRWVAPSFDYIPETIYKSLCEDGDIKCSYQEMLTIYRNVSKELYYKKILPTIFNERPGIIHLRRGDKGQCYKHEERIINVVNKVKYRFKNWIITSDDKEIPVKIINTIPKLIEPNWSENIKIKTLEQFFSYSRCSIIIQSVGSHCGWSGFSYVPFQLGLSIYQDLPGILISISEDIENTNLTKATKYAERDLFNIYMYNNINDTMIFQS